MIERAVVIDDARLVRMCAVEGARRTVADQRFGRAPPVNAVVADGNSLLRMTAVETAEEENPAVVAAVPQNMLSARENTVPSACGNGMHGVVFIPPPASECVVFGEGESALFLPGPVEIDFAVVVHAPGIFKRNDPDAVESAAVPFAFRRFFKNGLVEKMPVVKGVVFGPCEPVCR